MKPLIITSLVLIIVLAVIIELGTKPVVSRLENANVVYEEFPSIVESDLQKFSSFDSELGWERQPNESRKKDTGHQRPDNPTAETVVYSTDAYASRVCEIDRGAGEYSIATYGDSFCFCRDVEDNETFQHYLSQDLGVHVSNYGVGNYGLDQTLLRMKRRFDEDPADYTIIALCDKVAINRILSSWKHYYEFGNTFAVKPRFKLVEGSLETIPTPVNSREDLLRLEAHADYLRENDYHYENWFKPHLLKRPYSTYWLQSKNNIPYAIFSILEFFSRKVYSPETLYKKSKILKKNWKKKKRNEQIQYINHLENKFVGLLCNILK